MNGLNLILAQLDTGRELLPHPPKGVGVGDTTDSLIILGFILVLAAALFSWAYFLRKRPSMAQGSAALVRPKRRHHHHSREARRQAHRQEGESTRRIRVRRRRHRHSDDLKRNPTLEETGGLPPLRPEDPEGPSAAQSPS